MRHRLWIMALLAAHVSAQDAPIPSLPPALLQPLEAVARDLLDSGRAEDARQVAAALATLGHGSAAHARLAAAKTHPTARPANARATPEKLAAALRKAARGLVPQLAKLEPGPRRALARVILSLDGEVAEAHLALGRELKDGAWLDDLGRACRERRTQVELALAQARGLRFAIEVREVEHPLLASIGVAKATELRLGRMRIVTEWPAAKARRALTTTAQGSAFSRWLLTGQMGYEPRACTYVHLAQRVLYERAIAALQRAGTIDAAEAEAVRAVQAFDAQGQRYLQDMTEAALATAMLYDDCYYRIRQPWLLAGHVDWIGRTMFGARLGLYTYREDATARRTVASDADVERARMERLGEAGIAGARAWIRWLAERREDPPWSRAFVDATGKIPGDALIKATFVHEHLVERGLLASLVAAPREPEPFRVAVAAATAAPYETFEPTWRGWLLGAMPGLAERIAGKAEPPPTPDESAALAHLNALRQRALALQRYAEPTPPAVTLERSLSEGALLHVRYLRLNPEQRGAWPDAHEEYPDRPGFTAAGAFAGQHSVIAGAATVEDALDGWMGTFYHRLPLIDPGLLRVGFAAEDGTAVLDAGSMCRPTKATALLALWPPPDATDVPTRFAPEMPNPVPGEDQAPWGFPITFQHHLQPPHDPAAVAMTLCEGARGGPPVECWYSSPTTPTNPELSPADAYCLIPKAELRGKTLYTVVVAMPEREPLVWSFRTR